jgi:hypothetical protein
VLRHQLIVLRRKMRGRVQLANSDRWFFVQMHQSLVKFSESEASNHTPFLADFITTTVRQEKPDASSGRNSRPGKGNEPPHRESSLGLMEATT